jgi:glycosyltransferase involved in cell wall biosynthesis/MoaA/NifB/PqqE/SkfB family radical SAM enzyme
MKVLKVIHGYPPYYSAGSEVYSQNLSHELSKQGHEVMVFTREELTGQLDASIRDEYDEIDTNIKVRRVNMANHKDRYIHKPLDNAFEQTISDFKPDVVHFGHLNHLSINLPLIATRAGLPCIFTVHDFWMMCPRGQFIQMENNPGGEIWPLCDGQKSDKCADKCYRRYYAGDTGTDERDTIFWKDWVEKRMHHSNITTECFDTMICPSQQIMDRFTKDFPAAKGKLRFLDYGFNINNLTNRKRSADNLFTFGYIGTHTPAKGIGLLLQAFATLPKNAKLRIWGHSNGQETEAHKRQLTSYGNGVAERVEWMGGYRNNQIVETVFNHVDCIVVPSIWMENSPLVIHEAQQVRVPVITSSAGGMGEFVKDGVNGLTFTHRDPSSLASSMLKALNDPKNLATLGKRGYLYSSSGDIPEITEHTKEIVSIYHKAIKRRKNLNIAQLPSPWRITFDTNPDDCNLRCIMCEDHSPYSETQSLRRAKGREKRRMDVSVIRKVIQEQAPLGLKEIIPSTMGEPLLYEDFNQIIDLCNQYGIKLNLTTNGTFPKLGADTWAKKLVPVCSDVKISWNGGCKSTQEKIMIGTNWDKNLENIKKFIKVRDEIYEAGGNRCRITLQLTFMETNLDELPDIITLAASLGVDRVKGHHLWTHFNEIEHLSLKSSNSSIEKWNMISERCRLISEDLGNKRGVPLLLENFESLETKAAMGIEQERAGPCPFVGKEAWVNAQGRFDPCCCPDLLRRTLGNFGNVKDGLQKIWEGKNYKDLLSVYFNKKVCRTCNMRRLS